MYTKKRGNILAKKSVFVLKNVSYDFLKQDTELEVK